MVPSASARPSGTSAPAQGVSTRDLPYLFDEPGGEYERSLIHPPNRSPVIRMYICSPLRRGLRRRQERQPILHTSHPANTHPASEGC
jgi:hypothetical protein